MTDSRRYHDIALSLINRIIARYTVPADAMRIWMAAVVVVSVATTPSVDSGGSGSVRVKEAIQELYAEIRSLGPSAGTFCLDDGTSAKAEFVLDRLLRMVRHHPAAAVAAATVTVGSRHRALVDATKTAAVDGSGCGTERTPQPYMKATLEAVDDGDGRPATANGIDKMMDRRDREMSEAKNRDRAQIVASRNVKESSSPCAPDVVVDDLERRFLYVIDNIEKQKMGITFQTTTVNAHGPRRRHDCRGHPLAAQGNRPGGGLFSLFTRKRVSPGPGPQ